MRFSGTLHVALATVLVGSGSAVLMPGVAHADVVEATLVKTTWTGGPESTWTHPSPDPSGITYNSRTGQLLISDGEVEENDPTRYPKNVWMGTNLFPTDLRGNLLDTGANTMAYSAEPTGVGFRPTLPGFPERLFVSDDDQARVFEVDRGADGRYGTADDTHTSFSVAFTAIGPRADAEDVAVDLEPTRNSQLLIADGKGKRVFVYSPGPNKVFDGQAAEGGDDTVEQVVDIGRLGAGDPEGVAYNPSRNTMFVLDDPSNTIYELDLRGELQNIIKLPIRLKTGAGIALAPPSDGSGGAYNAYVVDRGVDNDTNQDLFNDGRLYEFAIPGLTGDGGGGGGDTETETETDTTSDGATSAIDARYASDADLRAALGAPVGSEQYGNGFAWRAYERGRLYWSGETGVRLIRGGILEAYLGAGGPSVLGVPMNDEGVAGGAGAYNHFTNGASIYWSPDTGAHVVRGAVKARWLALNAEWGLGFPTAAEVAVAGASGAVKQVFTRGEVYWSSPTGAHELRGGIAAAWTAAGGLSRLGLPTTGEVGAPGGAVTQEFARGYTVVWTPSGTQLVRGGVREAWLAQGGARGVLGRPVTDEEALGTGTGVYQLFANGKILWSPSTGAHAVYGAIGATYDRLGAEYSRLGLPTRGEYAIPGGTRADFQGGQISWNAATGATTVSYR